MHNFISARLRLSGTILALGAVLTLIEGHWMALQTVAWSRMLVDYSRSVPLSEAVAQTFDGRHPCPLCLKIQEERGAEQEDAEGTPGAQKQRPPDYVNDARRVEGPPGPNPRSPVEPGPQSLHTDYVEAPPTPPPR